MNISQRGIDLIKEFEGCSLSAYKDIVGVVTIGYGHTGEDVYVGQVITEADAEAILRADLDIFEKGVARLVKAGVTQGQFDALVSFAFNLGLGALAGSTLLRKLNAGDESAANEFVRWNKAGGKEVAGLTRRRLAEQELFRN